MNIVLGAESLEPPLTGIGQYTLNLLRALAAPGTDRVRYVHDLRLKPATADLAEPTGQRSAASRFWPRRARQAADDLLTCRSGADIVHGTNYRLPRGGRYCVVTVHDLVRLRFAEFLPPHRRRAMAHEMETALGAADLILTPSEAIRTELIAKGYRSATDVLSTPLGLNPGFRPRSAVEVAETLAAHGLTYRGFTLVVGTIEPRKNLVRLIAAYRGLSPHLRRQYPLVLCGKPGWQAEASLAAISAARAEGWLHYWGYASASDLHHLTAAAALAVQASLYEGYCLPLLEAMASGTPALASTDPALIELAGPAASLPALDPIGMGRRIEEALVSGAPSLQESAVSPARASARTWADCADRTRSAYSRLIRT
jgi:alpha-1,3-rhamnosyl/mannosyltransferase